MNEMSSQDAPSRFGNLLRSWRLRRGWTQLELAGLAEISTKHLSLLENGRAHPSRRMLLHLADLLEVPAPERNVLLILAGFAPTVSTTAIHSQDPALAHTIDMVLKSHEPFPATALDRHGEVLAVNDTARRFLREVAPDFGVGATNVFRLAMHPDGLAPHIANFIEWRAYALTRLQRLLDVSGDSVLAQLHREVSEYPVPERDATGTRRGSITAREIERSNTLIPFRYMTPRGVLTFYSIVTMLATPVDVTFPNIAIELAYPADAATAAAMRSRSTW